MKTFLVIAAAAFVACAARPAAAPSSRGPTATAVDGTTARRLVASGITVIDVRTPDEFATGHVPGARNIPHDEVGRRIAEVGPADAPVLLYCRSGRRSALAAQTLRERGYTRLYDMRTYDVWLQGEPQQNAPQPGSSPAAPSLTGAQ
jgi:rhodanese-related sulfurtransferase